jgi:ACR3 family arsenite efflux pump ArsB
MSSLAKLKNNLDKYLPVYVIIAMGLGFYFGLHTNVKAHKETFHWLNVFVVIMMIYPMMINLKLSEMKLAAKQWKQLSVALIMGLVLAPILMYLFIEFVGLFLPIHSQLAMGLLLAVVVPCSSMSIAYTGLTDGNLELATVIVAISFLLAIFVVPLWLKVFAAAYHVNISIWLLVITIVEVIIVPMILGLETRSILFKKMGADGFMKIRPLFPSISLIGMYLIVFLIFMEKAKLIASKPTIVLIALIPIALYYLVAFLIMTFVNKGIKLSYKDHMAITFTAVGKNEGTAMAIAMAAGMGLMAIPPAVVPILQIPFMIGYLKIAKRIEKFFGKVSMAEEELITVKE